MRSGLVVALALVAPAARADERTYEWAELVADRPQYASRERAKGRFAVHLFGGFHHVGLLGRGFNGLSLDANFGVARPLIGGRAFDVVGGGGYAYSTSASGLALHEAFARGAIRYRPSWYAIGVGPRWSVLTVGSDATSVSVLTFGVEGSLAVEPWRFASHALYLEARASAIVPWRGLDFGPITLALTIGGGFRY